MNKFKERSPYLLVNALISLPTLLISYIALTLFFEVSGVNSFCISWYLYCSRVFDESDKDFLEDRIKELERKTENHDK